MKQVRPESLGDAYPALCNFLRLTALSLAVPQLALKIQMGEDWRHGGVMNYGQLSIAALRAVLLSQPVEGTTRYGDQLLLSTCNRAAEGSQAYTASVLVGHLQGDHVRYHIAFYVPDLTIDGLSPVQIKTLQYLSQLLLLCLPKAQPPAATPMASADCPAPLPVNGIDLPPRVSPLSLASSTSKRRHQEHPRLADLVAQLQSCLSYKQLGKLLGAYLPYFFPHQSGRLIMSSIPPNGFKVLTKWGDAAPLADIEHQCCDGNQQVSDFQPRLDRECYQCRLRPDPATQCIVLGHLSDTTCIVQLTQLDETSLNRVQTTVLKKLSEQVLHVMQRLLLLDDLQDKALKDPLTGLLNRRHAETVLNGLCDAANRQQNMSLILIDIDHFKAINDTYGHQAGDAVLRNIGVLLRGHVRSQDIVYRYGGEEFCMVLLDTSPEVALKRADKIRRAVKYITNSFNGKVLPPLTISLGVASFPIHGETPEALITLADKALYWAKNHGRDRVVSVDHIVVAAQP